MAWYSEKKKPPVHESVLALTSLERMVEVTWTGKNWLNLQAAAFPVHVLYWRKLPCFTKPSCKKKSKKPTSLRVYKQKVVKFRYLQRVVYDKDNRKMHCI